MRKMLLIMAMAVVVCWLPGQALATTATTTSCETILNVLGTTTNEFPSSTEKTYGTVLVTLSNLVGSDYTKATIVITPTGGTGGTLDLDFGPGYQAALNLGTLSGVTVTGYSYSLPGGTGTATALSIAKNSSGTTFDSLGKFNVIGTLPSGDTDQESVTFTITGGSWTNANQVLVYNSAKNDAGAYVYLADCIPTAYIGDDGTLAPAPVPSAALLLGTGLLGLAMLGWRRKKY